MLSEHQRGCCPTAPARSSTEQQTQRVNKHHAHAPSHGGQGQQSQTLPSTSWASDDDLRQPRSPSTTQPSLATSERKSKLRLRNREAAQKCRKRKQRGIEALQNQEVAVEALHDSLVTEASQLQHEVLVLKNMVLNHGGCNCAFIEDYIQGAASNLVHQEGGCGGANFGTVEDEDTRDHIKVEPGMADQGYFMPEDYSLGRDQGNEPGLQQQYGNARGPGATDMGMGMSSLVQQGRPMHHLGLRS
ncbi:hypothetical protein F5X68DRAFT_258281 [Plectosphaerella plurivora]|uniref:BZIP domain-containing protein n=1 Tax=Plectosphaerella plurivora TaxID=936078 RepID=A0A9P8VNE1_9PEZI|nr:hypothetical protein F5X68DRAFT_258281 [Plectosphaerella plurivora]